MSELRPKRPTMAQLKAVIQPEDVLSRSNAEHWTGTLYMRRLSPYLTYLWVRTPITANGVTVLMIVVGFLAGAALLLPGIWGPVLAMLLAQVQMYLDCTDGEVARWRQKFSPKGIFLDQIGHFAAEGSIAIFLGIRAAGLLKGQTADGDAWFYAFLGALLLAAVWFNKSLNMMVTLARVNSGLGRLPDSPDVRAIQARGVLSTLRRVFRFVPFHRMFHSIEWTLVTLVVGVVTLFVEDPLAVWRGYVMALVVVISVVIVGHFLAIWKSPRMASQ